MSIEDNQLDSKQQIITRFHNLINADWDEEQKVEIALHNAIRNWFIEKWPGDNELLASVGSMPLT